MKSFAMVAALCGGMALVAGAGCGSDSKNNNDAATGTGGAGGLGAGSGSGGAGGDSATQKTVRLTGAAEVPPVASDGSGQVTVIWDAATRQVSITGNFEGLSSNATMAHLHGPASPTATAGVLFPLNISTPAAASGTVTGMGTLSVANWAAFVAGQTYVNIHTTLNPNGELRGQVTP